MSIEWGTVPDWVEAVSTTGALIAAGLAVVSASKQLQHLKAGDAERVAAERRSQASKVAAWLEHSKVAGTQVFYSNRSELPIYGVTIVCRTPWGIIEHVEFPVLRPTVQPTELKGVVESFQTTATPDTLKDWDKIVHRIAIGIAFLDANDTPWARHSNGHLRETGMLSNAVAALQES